MVSTFLFSSGPLLLFSGFTFTAGAQKMSPALAERLGAPAGVGSWKYPPHPGGAESGERSCDTVLTFSILQFTVYLSMSNTGKFCKFSAIPYFVVGTGVHNNR